jgi:hypothetical protein
MKKLQQLTKEVNELTTRIEQDYPELYQFLNENPVTIPNIESPVMNTEVFADYLDSLKQQLQHHIENHKIG